MSRFDAAAIAASYGSVSAVTFVTAMQYLEANQMSPGGHMAVALVIMESPAIVMAVLLANALRHAQVRAVTISSSGGAATATLNRRNRWSSLEAIERLLPGERLRLLIHREPKMLYPILQEWGFAYQTTDREDGTYEILIWHKDASP